MLAERNLFELLERIAEEPEMRIQAAALQELLVRHGSDPRIVGSLHGRRLAHLRRDRRTGEGPVV